MKAPRSILVICIRYLGDTLLLRPPLRALRKAFPAARIDVLVAGGTGVALEGCPHMDRVMEWPVSSFGKVAWLGLGIFATGYDWAIDFTGNDRSSLVAILSRAGCRIAYARPKKQRFSLRSLAFNKRVPYRRPKPHILVQRLELLSACGIAADGLSCDLVPDPPLLERARELTKGLPARRLHIHPTSRDMQKAIPEVVLRGVLNHLVSEGWGVVVTTGRSEAERGHVRRALPEVRDNCRIFSDLSWGELVAMVSTATGYWGCDTAPAHLASALEIPTRIEFGPSHAVHWKPLHSTGEAVVHPCACRSEQSGRRCPAGQPGRCLEAIRVDDVVRWAALT
ncbi:MAG: putative lipopolysaccharide heptosyltransferase III [Terrimicrobiaceae bacterium]